MLLYCLLTHGDSCVEGPFIGDFIVRWTARLAVACYVSRLICDISRLPGTRGQRTARCWWTLGCACFVIHVAAAFHFEHRWNHTAAYEYTSTRTTELTGWNSGAGLYVNEAFLCLWLADTVLWWRNLNWSQNRYAYWLVQGIFGFLMFQATAVFGPLFWRPIVLAVSVILVILSLRTSAIKRKTDTDASCNQTSS